MTSALFLPLLCPQNRRKEQSEMQLIITGKNMEVSEPLKEYVEKKIGKLDRYLPTIDEVHVELSVEKVKSNQDRQVVQVTMRSNGTILRAEERSADMLAAVDSVRDKLQRQIERYKERPVRKRERARARPPRPELAPRKKSRRRGSCAPSSSASHP